MLTTVLKFTTRTSQIIVNVHHLPSMRGDADKFNNTVSEHTVSIFSIEGKATLLLQGPLSPDSLLPALCPYPIYLYAYIYFPTWPTFLP
jgi:hypothetical protein